MGRYGDGSQARRRGSEDVWNSGALEARCRRADVEDGVLKFWRHTVRVETRYRSTEMVFRPVDVEVKWYEALKLWSSGGTL